MKLSLEERQLVKEYAKKLKEGSFSVNTYNFKPGVPIKVINTKFKDLMGVMESLMADIESNMSTKSLIYRNAESLYHKLSDISEDIVNLHAKYEKEGSGGNYLTPVTDPDTLAKIAKYNKGK